MTDLPAAGPNATRTASTNDAARWPSGVAIRLLRADEIELVQGLWRELLVHLDELGSAVPLVPHEQSWPRRRAAYEELLADGRSFALGAWRDEGLIGYAMVHVAEPDPVWATGATFVELSTLSVTRRERGAGVGTALLDEVERELTGRGIDQYVIGVDSVNEGAKRFYEGRGFRVGFHLLHGHISERPAAAGGGRAAGDTAGRAEVPQRDIAETPDTAMHGEP